MMPRSNLTMTVAELARVKEVPADQKDLPANCEPRRLFHAHNADGSVCIVGSGGLFLCDTAYCFTHDTHAVHEGIIRVRCVLDDERVKKGLLSLEEWPMRSA